MSTASEIFNHAFVACRVYPLVPSDLIETATLSFHANPRYLSLELLLRRLTACDDAHCAEISSPG